MPHSSGSHLISEIGVGGQGGRNIASDENQNWWTSKMPSCPPTTTTSPIELAITSSPIKTDCSQLNTNHIIDYNTLSKFLKEDMYCKSCVNKFVKEYCKQSLRDFVTYFTSNRQQKLSIEQQCESFLEQDVFDFPISTMKQPLIVVSTKNYGLASEFKVSCLTCQKLISKLEPARSNSNGDRNDEIRNNAIEAKHFSINKQFILGCHEAGMGPADADIICSAMNLPLTFGFWSTQGNFGAVEELVGNAEVTATALAMKEACQEEIYLTLNVHERGDWADKGRDFQWWNSLTGMDRLSVLNMPRLTVSYDMGWQQRSSGNKYNSVSGHAFCIGGYTKKILDYRVKSKVCNVCDRAIRYKKPIKEHVCPKNHVTGSSKAMEPDAGVEMMIDAVMKNNVIYSTIICDDDSTIRAVSKWSYKELLKLQPSFQWPRTLKGLKKSDKGCLPLTVPEPTFLSDPSHRVRVLLRPAFMKSNGPVSLERPSKADCLRLKVYYGAWIKKNRNLSLAEFSISSKAPINHLFGCHDYCSETWCPVKAGKMVSNGKYHDKEKEKDLYEWLMLHVATKVEGEKLLSLHHPFDTQINEAMNNAVSRRCPKNKVFAGSGGLQYRVASVAGQHTQGATQYTRNVYKQCGMQMSALQESFWRQKEKRRSDDGAYKAQFKRKRKRSEKIHAARFETVKQERQDNKSGKTYGSGVALTRREHQETRRKGTIVCNHCGRNDHQRKSSALCPFNVPAGKVPDHTGMRMINDDQLPTTVDIVPANTQENVTCASSVASLGLQDRANQPNQLSVSN